MDSFNLISNKAKKGVSRFFACIFSFFKNKTGGIFSFFRPGRDVSSARKQRDFDRKLVFSLSKSRIPSFRQLKYLNKYLTPTEVWLVRASIFVIIAGFAFMGTKFYITHRQIVPVEGGKYTEALVGAPKNINPLYSSVRDADGDISALIFSSLFKRGKNGELVKDLVSEYEVSEDRKIYTVTIRNNALWHDGANLTSEDVVFTFNSIKNGEYRSPLKASFTGAEIEAIDDYRFRFVLVDPYAAFLDLLTFGVMPANIWLQIPPESAGLAELNLKPVGSGPYKFDNFIKDKKTGQIKEYNLVINDKYYGRVPYINVSFRFFPSFEEAILALNNNAVDGISYLPREKKDLIITPKALNFHRLYLPQLTAIFLNRKDNESLGDKNLRKALAYAVDRNSIVNDSLSGDAYIVDGPILPNNFAYNNDVNKYDYNPAKAAELMDSIDWKLTEVTEDDIRKAEEDKNSGKEDVKKSAEEILNIGAGKWRKKNGKFLTINLKTVERNEGRAVLEELKKYWEEVGVKTNIEIVSTAKIQSDVIRPRNFDALFYGQVIGADPDPYAFWHSSQTGEDGFNISNYNNKYVDELLEDARLIIDHDTRKEKYSEFQKIITDEVPAIFMYSPVYIYVHNKILSGFDATSILFPGDRFSNISEWYLKTGKKLVW